MTQTWARRRRSAWAWPVGLVVLVALALAATSAAAAAGHTVVSLVGREFTLVQYRPAVGSNASRDTSDRFAVGSAALDDAAVLAADDVIRRGSGPWPGRSSDPDRVRDASHPHEDRVR